MGSILLKKTAFLIFIVLTHNSFCQCDEISEKMEAFEKRLHHLEEQNGLKERRIKDLEATKVEIVTELQSLALKSQEAENNQNALGTIHILRTLFRALTAEKAGKIWSMSRFWVLLGSYKKQPVKKFWGRIMDLAWLKFTMAALLL